MSASDHQQAAPARNEAGDAPAPARFPDLAGRHVFITGGGAGIGAALTKGFLLQGCKVSFVQRSDATQFCRRMEQETGSRPEFIPCDITDIPALEEAMATARNALGPVDIAINNAANDTRHTLAEMAEEEWDRCQAVNLKPHFFVARYLADDLKRNGEGVIINMSSISYMLGNAGYPCYMAAKSGIIGLTRALARELGAHGVRVNALLPGWVMTERQRRLWVTEEALAAHLELQCLKRPLQPEDIVGPTLFLASRASAMITAQALVVDGGAVFTG